MIAKKRRWSDRVKMVDFPMIPGYIFARIDWQSENRTLFQCPGIKGCIREGGGGRPAIMPDVEIESLKIVESRAQDLRVNAENYMPGEPVRIANGPMKGLVGTVERAKSRTRVYIRLSLLNTVVSADFAVEDIEKGL
jgi:transcription antitermination factor NusG